MFTYERYIFARFELSHPIYRTHVCIKNMGPKYVGQSDLRNSIERLISLCKYNDQIQSK